MINYSITADIKQYDLGEAIEKSLIQSTLEVQGKAVRFAPYETGNLRRSIATEVKKDKGIVGTNVKYARKVEYVNKKNPSRKFYMKRALETSIPKIERIFTKNITNVFNNTK